MDLSVIILNYNSGKYLNECLKSITKSKLGKCLIEVIVVDNCSTDNSIKLAKLVKSSYIKYLELKTNKGFAYGNNQGVKIISPKTKHVLFLNPDTKVKSNTLKGMLDFFNSNAKVDAATCSIILASTNKIQPECHRGFPYPWRSLCYFSGLSKLFPNSKFFAGYFLGNLNKKTIHPIEACVGAFLMIKTEVGKKVKWWNEKYFFYGEDLDFCYQLKDKKYNLFFNPKFEIIHYQGISSGIKSQTKHITQASRKTKIMIAKASTQAMRIFYQENLIKDYPAPLKFIVMCGIKLLETQRVFKAKYL
ncbi:MAG: glycosyltransferase family 2 protein [Candidatus Shapirobacteria bacterium]